MKRSRYVQICVIFVMVVISFFINSKLIVAAGEDLPPLKEMFSRVGDAKIKSDETGEWIELTNKGSHKGHGAMWNKDPVDFSQDFEGSFQIQIISNDNGRDAGDGIAFVFQRANDRIRENIQNLYPHCELPSGTLKDPFFCNVVDVNYEKHYSKNNRTQVNGRMGLYGDKNLTVRPAIALEFDTRYDYDSTRDDGIDLMDNIDDFKSQKGLTRPLNVFDSNGPQNYSYVKRTALGNHVSLATINNNEQSIWNSKSKHFATLPFYCDQGTGVIKYGGCLAAHQEAFLAEGVYDMRDSHYLYMKDEERYRNPSDWWYTVNFKWIVEEQKMIYQIKGLPDDPKADWYFGPIWGMQYVKNERYKYSTKDYYLCFQFGEKYCNITDYRKKEYFGKDAQLMYPQKTEDDYKKESNKQPPYEGYSWKLYSNLIFEQPDEIANAKTAEEYFGDNEVYWGFTASNTPELGHATGHVYPGSDYATKTGASDHNVKMLKYPKVSLLTAKKQKIEKITEKNRSTFTSEFVLNLKGLANSKDLYGSDDIYIDIGKPKIANKIVDENSSIFQASEWKVYDENNREVCTGNKQCFFSLEPSTTGIRVKFNNLNKNGPLFNSAYTFKYRLLINDDKKVNDKDLEDFYLNYTQPVTLYYKLNGKKANTKADAVTSINMKAEVNYEYREHGTKISLADLGIDISNKQDFPDKISTYITYDFPDFAPPEIVVSKDGKEYKRHNQSPKKGTKLYYTDNNYAFEYEELKEYPIKWNGMTGTYSEKDNSLILNEGAIVYESDDEQQFWLNQTIIRTDKSEEIPKNKIKKVEFDEDISVKSSSNQPVYLLNMFASDNCMNQLQSKYFCALEEISGFEHLKGERDVQINMAGMFTGNSNIKKLDLSGVNIPIIDTGKYGQFQGAFQSMEVLEEVILPYQTANFKIIGNTKYQGAFSGANRLSKIEIAKGNKQKEVDFSRSGLANQDRKTKDEFKKNSGWIDIQKKRAYSEKGLNKVTLNKDQPLTLEWQPQGNNIKIEIQDEDTGYDYKDQQKDFDSLGLYDYIAISIPKGRYIHEIKRNEKDIISRADKNLYPEVYEEGKQLFIKSTDLISKKEDHKYTILFSTESPIKVSNLDVNPIMNFGSVNILSTDKSLVGIKYPDPWKIDVETNIPSKYWNISIKQTTPLKAASGKQLCENDTPCFVYKPKGNDSNTLPLSQNNPLIISSDQFDMEKDNMLHWYTEWGRKNSDFGLYFDPQYVPNNLRKSIYKTKFEFEFHSGL